MWWGRTPYTVQRLEQVEMEYIHWVKGWNSSRLLRIVKPKIINHSSFIKARNGDQSSSGPRVFSGRAECGVATLYSWYCYTEVALGEITW